MPVGHGKKGQFNHSVFKGFLAEERQVEDVFCSPALNPFYPTNQFFRQGRPERDLKLRCRHRTKGKKQAYH